MDSFSSSTSVLASQSDITSEQFWTALNIWHKNPHFVSRRLCGSVVLFSGVVTNSLKIDHEQLICSVISAHKTSSLHENICEKLNSNGVNCLELKGDQQDGSTSSDVLLTIKKLIPRKSDKYRPCLEMAILHKSLGLAFFVPLDCNPTAECDGLVPVSSLQQYSLQLVNKQMQLCMKTRADEDTENILYPTWLKSSLFPKLVKWAQLSDPVCSSKVVRSLSLVSVEEYIVLYEQLKNKYGKEMVKIWPETTDPSKFVYEDVAIATYLLLIWAREREEKNMPDWKQSFVDLGCGNGLLVYILSSEGHRGLGLDVRKRGIWDLYPETTKLEVCGINPSDGCTFSDFDWLIGNHSDELTPWIPVLAHRSSYSCSFFLLPCCFYDFAGNKYQRMDTSLSQYEDYLTFVRQVCDTCGFLTQIDKLRIPSTKRTCLIGNARTYPISKSLDAEEKMNAMIKTRCEGQVDFKPRESEEKVRNCTQLKEGVTEQVIQIIVKELLSKTENVSKERKWNPGGKLTLRELAETIPKDLLLELKSECGGLQTLLRNKRHIFEVLQGSVNLREPLGSDAEIMPRSTKKQKTTRYNRPNVNLHVKKRCWFFDNHPDGCPLKSELCLSEHQEKTIILT